MNDPIILGNRIIEFSLEGEPVAWHRSGYNAYEGRIFKNKKDVVWQNYVRTYAILNRPKNLPTCPVILTVMFRMPRPKYHKSGIHYPHTKKPDLDNLVKSVKDAMTKSMYQDDSQIIIETVSKIYHDKPGVDIKLEYIHQGEST